MRASILLLAFAAAACAVRVRENTQPPSFEYIESSRLHSSMWRLASEVGRLDHALREPAADPADQQRQVGEILTAMESTVEGIATPGSATQHPLLNRNLPRFREQVRRARADAERQPPSYFSATTLVGSCSACHGIAGTGRARSRSQGPGARPPRSRSARSPRPSRRPRAPRR